MRFMCEIVSFLNWQNNRTFQDCDEPGASALVSQMEDYALEYMSAANISHDEDFPPLYLRDEADFSVHQVRRVSHIPFYRGKISW